MKKVNIIILILGCLLVIIPFMINIYSIYRIISIAIGIILITFGLSKLYNIYLTFIIPIILVLFTYSVDLLLFTYFDRIPVYSIKVESSEYVSTYDSLLYRIYSCNEELTMDYGYKAEFLCNIDYLDTIDVNTFLNDYNSYLYKFVRLSGKISKISALSSITLSKYEETEDTLNGYVNFNLNYNVLVNTNIDLSNYRIYDNIQVIGKVTSIEENSGVYTVTIDDTILIESSIYDNYTYDIISNNTNTYTSITSNYYYYNISAFNVIYEENNIYELSYLLTDGRFTWNTLINNTIGEELLDLENNYVATYYELEEYNLLDCSNGIKIISTEKLEYNMCNLT